MTVRTLLGDIELPNSLDQFVKLENSIENWKQVFWQNVNVLGYFCGVDFDFNMYTQTKRLLRLAIRVDSVLERLK